jgi:hypothetical protein
LGWAVEGLVEEFGVLLEGFWYFDGCVAHGVFCHRWKSTDYQ